MPKRFPDPIAPLQASVPDGTNSHSVGADSGWPALRAALEAGDRDLAEQLAYHLGIPASIIEPMQLAVGLATECEEIVSRTADAVERLATIRAKIIALRSYVPASIQAAEELADRWTELTRQEAAAMNDGGHYGSAVAALAGCWCMFPELFGKPAGAYLGRPTGALEEWVQAHGVDIRARDWWRHVGETEQRRTVRIIPAHSSAN